MSRCAIDPENIPYPTVAQNIRNLCRLRFNLSVFNNFPYAIGAVATRHARSAHYTNKQAADTVGYRVEQYYIKHIARDIGRCAHKRAVLSVHCRLAFLALAGFNVRI